MTFTYALPPATALARVRLEIGDTVPTRALLQDEEIQVKLTARPNSELLAAADCCDLIATRSASGYDFKWKDGEFKRSQMATLYADRAAVLRARAASDGTLPLYSFPPISYPLVF
jgi:hypothetical protein